MKTDERSRLLLKFDNAQLLCTDMNTQAQIIALRAHAELVTLQIQSLEINLMQFGKEFLMRPTL